MSLDADQVLIYVGGGLQSGVCLTKIHDGCGGIEMFGSCIEGFDPGSIFNKLAS